MPRSHPAPQVDLAALSAQLKQAAPDSLLDDHARWISRLKALADAIIWSAYGILLLIAIATAAAVSFATRAGLEAHHEMVELLHQMGAHSNFIARAFERHYFVSALGAAAVGAALAAVLFPRCRRTRIRRHRGGAIPAAVGAQAEGSSVAACGAGGVRPDRAGDGAAFGSRGAAGDLLNVTGRKAAISPCDRAFGDFHLCALDLADGCTAPVARSGIGRTMFRLIALVVVLYVVGLRPVRRKPAGAERRICRPDRASSR